MSPFGSFESFSQILIFGLHWGVRVFPTGEIRAQWGCNMYESDVSCSWESLLLFVFKTCALNWMNLFMSSDSPTEL